ncbi:MAG: hypothetical protein ACTSRI_19900 [Promethearchaeota archaeon]
MGKDKSDDKHIPLVGSVEEYVGRSPWDFYSWGHIDMGIASFLLLSLMITITEALIGPSIFNWWHIMIFVLIFGVVWEIFENTVLYLIGAKFENRQDSIWNLLWDIIFVCIGGLAMWLLKFIIMDSMGRGGTWFYVSGSVAFVIILICYFIGFFITSRKT